MSEQCSKSHFLWCKIFVLKNRRCKILEKYHVWARALIINQENSDNVPSRNCWLGCLVFQIYNYFESLRSSASPHKKHVAVVGHGQWSSSQQGWTTSSTSYQVGKLKFTLQQFFKGDGQGGARFSQLAATSLEGHHLILIKLVSTQGYLFSLFLLMCS